MNREQLTTEQQLVVLLCRITFSEAVINDVKELLKKEINWFEVLQYVIINKVPGLFFYNIERLGLANHVHLLVYQILKFYYIGTQERNKIFLKELNEIRSEFSSKGIRCIPLKGAYLLGRLYKDIGSRSINDLDLMIDNEQIEAVINAIEYMGYVAGDYDRSNKEIVRYSRAKEITWKLKMNNLPSYVKAVNSQYVDYFAIDFALTLDLERDLKPVRIMLHDAAEDYLRPAHFFIHLCCHLYKEATGAIWIYLNSDINLIKFCDVREYIINFMDNSSLEEAIDFTNKYNFGKPIYFTLYFLKEIYKDGYEDKLIQKIHIEDKEFIDYFGSIDFGQKVKWNKSFWNRVFSYSNKEALVAQEDFINKYRDYLNL